MLSPRALLGLALVAFGLTVIARFPARGLPALLPEGVTCTNPAGTLWRGSCADFEARGFRAGPIRWSLRPWSLLAGKAAAQLRIAPPGSTLEGEFAVALFGGTLEGREVRGDLDLRPGGLLPGIPADLSGRIRLALDEFAIRERVVMALRGVIEVSDLQQRTADGLLPLGRYSLRFEQPPAAGGDITGRLSDDGGPLSVEGTLALTSAPGYLLNGTVALRPEAPPALARQIAFLGSADANGRRPFAQEATF